MKRAADDDEEESTEVDQVWCSGCRVFFHSEVSKKSVKQLILKMQEACEFASKTQLPEDDVCIYLYIHSNGGDAFAGVSAMNHIKSCRYKVVTVVDGFCASAATLMFLAGKERQMMSHSQFLIHQLTTGFFGKYCDLKDELKNSTLLMETFENIYLKETKIPPKKLKEYLNAEMCMNTQECLKFQVIDKII